MAEKRMIFAYPLPLAFEFLLQDLELGRMELGTSAYIHNETVPLVSFLTVVISRTLARLALF